MPWGAAAAVVGAGISANGAESAGATQASAGSTSAGIQMLGQIQNINRNQPFVDAGIRATDRLENGFQSGQFGGGANFTPQQFLANQDPGYGFQLNQGQQALQNSQSAGSGIMSGSALKGLINYNQGAASTGYQNAYNRWLSTTQNAYSQLTGQQAAGQNAANGLGTTGATAAQGMGSSLMGAANGSAAGTVGASNAISQGLSNGAGYYQLNGMLNGGGGSSSSGLYSGGLSNPQASSGSYTGPF